MISFNGIPVGIRTPGAFIEIDATRATQGLPPASHKILVIGQKLPTGTVAVNTPTRMLSVAQAEDAFGRGSMLAVMIAALKAANRTTDTFAIALDDDATGVAAAGAFDFTGSATGAGTLVLYVGGARLPVSVSVGMTAAQIAAAAATAINGYTALPVSAIANADRCAVAFRHKGAVGNDFDLRVNYGFGESLPPGVAVAITPVTGGTENPGVGAAIAALGDDLYDTWVVPYLDAPNLTAIESELERRWGPMVQREGQAFAGAAGTLATMTTLGNSRNSKHLTLVGAGMSPTPAWVVAAVTAAIDAAEPDPARPRQTLALPGCLAPIESARPTREERDVLLHEGISTLRVDDGGVVRIERLITTYQVNPQGDADTSYLDIETMRTLAYVRTAVRQRIADRFPRHKLANDGTWFGPGQAVATPKLIRAELQQLFREMERAGLVENFDQFKSDLIVERNANDPNRVDVLFPPDLINQLRVIAAQVQFLL
ncbi:phage tail sheath C-terminal domain-containing protein [Pseudoxanthomonas sp. UTMC 1351]|uniref:phage tail sheath C-terminal domain-containing protein n=1 Tax=Pseudoxanthomonas sp. UTMC 1351 TaxID=2695853 RepID=UPI0034CE7F76